MMKMKENHKFGASDHMAPVPLKKSNRSSMSSSSWAGSMAPGASAGPALVWQTSQSPGHAIIAQNCSRVGHMKGVEP